MSDTLLKQACRPEDTGIEVLHIPLLTPYRDVPKVKGIYCCVLLYSL